jgi:hypothetical protein
MQCDRRGTKTCAGRGNENGQCQRQRGKSRRTRAPEEQGRTDIPGVAAEEEERRQTVKKAIKWDIESKETQSPKPGPNTT